MSSRPLGWVEPRLSSYFFAFRKRRHLELVSFKKHRETTRRSSRRFASQCQPALGPQGNETLAERSRGARSSGSKLSLDFRCRE